MGMIEALRLEVRGVSGSIGQMAEKCANIEKVCVGKEQFEWYQLQQAERLAETHEKI